MADSKPLECGQIAVIAFDSGVDAVFDYLLPDELGQVSPGQRVEVPFGRGNRIKEGFCVEIRKRDSAVKEKYKLKAIKKIVDSDPLIDEHLMALTKWISDYYVAPLGQTLAAMVPSAVKKGVGGKEEKSLYLAVKQESLAKTIGQLRGKKQKAILEFLSEKNAYSIGNAIAIEEVLAECDTTAAPVKKLLQAGLIKIKSERVFKTSLPVLPEGLTIKSEKVILNSDQDNALAAIGKMVEREEFEVALLHGVTDSGKTEVYIRAIEKTLAAGRDAIVLLPEIALTAQTVQRFSSRFDSIAVVHSRLTAAQRNVEWQKIRSGKARVVVGARSAVFAPVKKLGLIVVDEEHESSYKQDTVPRYNGRDVAVKRAHLAEGVCILGSATPSLETLYNCRKKKHYTLLSLPKRVMDLPRPVMKIVDMTQEKYAHGQVNLISEALEKALAETLAKGEQAILLLNRRGYSNFIYCPNCRYSLKCKNCDVALTFHKSQRMRRRGEIAGRIGGGYAMCHYCMSQTLVPKKCPLCGKPVIMIGQGSQRLEDEVKNKFSSANVVRVDSDSMGAGGNYYKLLSDFDKGEIDVLAGTQILAKGLHFPNVTLVGIINADTSLSLPDFRANERTYSLICQVAGRAGRSEKGGRVFVQTFMPTSKAITYAVDGNFGGFVADELEHRVSCRLPPFGRMAIVRMKDMSFEKLEAAADVVGNRLKGIVDSQGLGSVKINGPMPPAIARVQRHYRMQIIVQSGSPVEIGRLFGAFRAMEPPKPAVVMQVDIDPVNCL